MNLGPHAAFIVASYGAALVIVPALIAWVVFDYQKQTRLLHDLETRGAKRRSRTSRK